MAAEHSVGFEPADRLAEDRESVRRRFWRKLKRVAAHLPFSEDLLAAYYCAFDRDTPLQVKATLGSDLKLEPDLSRWFPVFGAPGL